MSSQQNHQMADYQYQLPGLGSSNRHQDNIQVSLCVKDVVFTFKLVAAVQPLSQTCICHFTKDGASRLTGT